MGDFAVALHQPLFMATFLMLAYGVSEREIDNTCLYVSGLSSLGDQNVSRTGMNDHMKLPSRNIVLSLVWPFGCVVDLST